MYVEKSDLFLTVKNRFAKHLNLLKNGINHQNHP